MLCSGPGFCLVDSYSLVLLFVVLVGTLARMAGTAQEFLVNSPSTQISPCS